MKAENNLTMEVITEPPIWNCPHCGQYPDGFVWADGETIPTRPALFNYDAEMLWGKCPLCSSELYMLEIGVVPDGINSRFILDHSWEAETNALYETRIAKSKNNWTTVKYKTVTGISVIGPDDRIKKMDVPMAECL